MIVTAAYLVLVKVTVNSSRSSNARPLQRIIAHHVTSSSQTREALPALSILAINAIETRSRI